MNALLNIVMPVLQDMPESHLKHALLQAFPRGGRHFDTIEAGFQRLTAQRQDADTLRRFFQSWSQTNNSAMTVSGISNRLSLLIHRAQPVADESELLRAIVSLNRIVDEDLAVTHKILHSQLFYTMACNIVGDDLWLSHDYIDPTAKAFKAWKDSQSLREDDLMVGLLTTLVHEIYTHGEVEFILPMFQRWLGREYGFGGRESMHTLGWISVHCGPTEKNHFFHALDAITHYAAATGARVEDYDLGAIVDSYLRRKAAVLEALFPVEIDVAA